MPSPLENPFLEHKQRKPGVTGLVGDVFGEKAKAALERRIGREKGSASQTAEENWGDIVSMKEREKMREEIENRQWKRERYIEWAEEIGHDEEWVDRTFVFQPDGRTIVKTNLWLSEKKVTGLPQGLFRIEGELNMNQTGLTTLVGFPQQIFGSVYLQGNHITSLEGFPKIAGNSISLAHNHITALTNLPENIIGHLALSFNPLASLEGLPKYIDGDLYLLGIPAKEIPEGLRIEGEVHVSPSQIALAEDVRRKGYRIHDP